MTCLLENVQQHVGLNVAEHVKDICAPLNDAFKIDYFHYFKTYDDNTCVSLSNRPDFVEHRFKYVKGVLRNNYGKKIYHILWDSVSEDNRQVFIDAEKHYNIRHGISIVEKVEDGVEFYHFAVSKDDPTINEFYLNEAALLRHFILYFKSHAQVLLGQCEDDKIIVPVKDNKSLYFEQDDQLDSAKKQFLENTAINRVYLACGGITKYLTSREFSITKFVLQHQPIKLIARQLNISPRTVNAHLRNIYDKLDCANKFDLALILKNNNIDIFG